MFTAIITTFFAGLFAANAVPHLVKGLTHERFPTPFGSTPVANFIGGFIMLLLVSLLFVEGHASQHATASFWSAVLGVLVIGLFHSIHGAFGKK
ncbi:MAG TPA: hypothetical protein VLG16_01925 [Candidatus Saccharimonadales bacterium]|nr:hypothetical protein [Candidatus Saccharimonadales bacterium]